MGDRDQEAPVERIAQRGLYFEELRTGVVYEHRPGRTVTEADNTLFTTLTMNPAGLHLDAHFSASTEFGRPLVNSLFTLSTLVGLSVGQLTQATTVANLGFGAVEFPGRCSTATRSTRRAACSTSGSPRPAPGTAWSASSTAPTTSGASWSPAPSAAP
ncbi:MaoC family dehydratase [Nocardiopsis composta]